MWSKFIELLKYYSEQGARLPAAYDSDKKGASVTLLFTHIANLVAIISIAILVYKDTTNGTIAAILYSIITMILYMMRRVTSFKADLDDKSIEIEGEDSNEK